MVNKWLSYPFLLFALAGGLCAQEIDLEEGLVARYLFNGNVLNEASDAHHGVDQNISYVRDRFDQPGACVSFNGTNARITIAHASDLNWDARSQSFSISFWVKSASPQTSGSPQQLLGKWRGSASEAYPFAFQLSDSSLTSSVFDGRTAMDCTFDNPWDDQWHHLAMVYNHSTQSMSSYRDGAWFESKSVTFSASSSNELDIYVGYAPSPAGATFYRGLLDDLYFYSRELLPCEIEALHSGQLTQER